MEVSSVNLAASDDYHNSYEIIVSGKRVSLTVVRINRAATKLDAKVHLKRWEKSGPAYSLLHDLLDLVSDATGVRPFCFNYKEMPEVSVTVSVLLKEFSSLDEFNRGMMLIVH